jgi:alkaline phosphatase D
MQVKPFSVGPVVGHVDRHSARIFGRGEPLLWPAELKPDAGVIRWRRQGAGQWSAPLRFRLNRNFDFSGVVILPDLDAGTHYEYQAGCLPGDPGSRSLQWREISSGQFRTAPADDAAPIRFHMGSCCYRFFAADMENLDDRADKAFRSMLALSASDGPVDFNLFVGDQVYADPMNALLDLHDHESFMALYRHSFAQPWLTRLLADGANYMILDDHEIENNWPAQARAADWVGKYPAALKAYQVYQASHSPAVPLDASGRYLGRDPDHLWYTFSRGCADFFVMDVRTERQLASTAGQRLMLSAQQEQALYQWLLDGRDRVKCLVSPVVMFPDQRRFFRGDDAWEGFLAQRTRILEFIRRENLHRVLVLSGDVHAALATRLQMRSAAGRNLAVHNLVCSGLFWPASLFAFRWHALTVDADGPLRSHGRAGRYRLTPLTDVYSRDAFARIEIDPEGCLFRVFTRKGEPVPEASCEIRFTG